MLSGTADSVFLVVYAGIFMVFSAPPMTPYQGGLYACACIYHLAQIICTPNMYQLV